MAIDARSNAIFICGYNAEISLDNPFNALKIQLGQQINGIAIKPPKHTDIITKNLYVSLTDGMSSRPTIFEHIDIADRPSPPEIKKKNIKIFKAMLYIVEASLEVCPIIVCNIYHASNIAK